MKLLLDTNVLVDYYAQRQPFAAAANKIVVAGLLSDVELWACAHSFPDILFILRRALPSQDLQKAMRSSLEFIHVCTVTHDDIAASLELAWSDGEDALVSRCAQRVKADYLITRDEGGFVEATSAVMSPDSWLRFMKERYGIEYDEVAF